MAQETQTLYLKVRKNEDRGAEIRKEPSRKEVEEIGRGTWRLLHGISRYFPKHPSEVEKKAVSQLFSALSVLYPCRRCSKVFETAGKAVDSSSRDLFVASLCDLHNFVNFKLNKPEFDCKLLVSGSEAVEREEKGSMFSRVSGWIARKIGWVDMVGR